MDGPEWAAGKLSEDHKDNRWSLLSADLRELEQHSVFQDKQIGMLWARVEHLEGISKRVTEWSNEHTDLRKRVEYLETVCEQCILEHQGRSI